MRCLIVSLESFQNGIIPEEVKQYITANKGDIFTVLDESSKIKCNEPCKETKMSKRAQAILKLNKIGERCILTGTFMSKSPVNAYNQMNFLKDGFFPESMYAFAERYVIRRTLQNVRGARITITQKDYEVIRRKLLRFKDDPNCLAGVMDGIYSFYGITREDCFHILQHEEYTPFKNLDELWRRIGDNVVKVDRKDLFDIPPKLYKTYNVELTAEQKKLYLQLQNQHCTDKVVVDNGLKLYLRFQDICNGYEPVDGEEYFDKEGKKHNHVDLVPLKENPKLDMLEEVMEEIGDKQVVVWCSRSRLLYDARSRLQELGYTCGVYDGKVGNDEREKDYEAFGRGDIQIMFANPRSAGYGLDGFKRADYAIYLCNSYSVEERIQSEFRIQRGIEYCNKYIFDITCKGTCEHKVTEALNRGIELVNSGVTDVSLFELEE